MPVFATGDFIIGFCLSHRLIYLAATENFCRVCVLRETRWPWSFSNLPPGDGLTSFLRSVITEKKSLSFHRNHRNKKESHVNGLVFFGTMRSKIHPRYPHFLCNYTSNINNCIEKDKCN